MLVFNLALSFATGILFGLAPAWQAWKTNVSGTLQEASRSYTSSGHHRLRGAFVVAEMALTLARNIHKKSGLSVPYDIKNTNVHQIYKGRLHNARFKKIIDQTRGVVLVDRRDILY